MNGWMIGITLAAMMPEPPITAITFTPNGREVVVGSQAGVTVHTWPELERRRVIPTELAHVHDLAFSPDGRQLAIGGGSPGAEGMVERITWPEGKPIRQHAGHEDLIFSIAWKQDSTEYVTAGLDHRLVVWNAETGEQRHSIKGHSRGVTTVMYLPGEQGFLSGGLDGSLRLWDIRTGEVRRTFNNHTRAVRGLAMRPGEGLPMVASISEDRTVRLWQPTIGRMVRFARLESAPLAVTWIPDGSRLVVACEDGKVRIIDPDTVTVERVIPAISGWAYTLAVHPDGTRAIVGGRGGQMKQISIKGTE